LLKKTITYKDFTGEEQTEDFYFHLTEADVIELEVSANGNSLSAWTEKIVKANNGAEIIATFKKIIAVSYGVKSDDGRRFIKNDELLAEFRSTNAYSKLFMALSTSAGEATEFVNGIMPEGMPAAGRATQGDKTASELARQASAERMQGFRKPQDKPEQTAVRQPDLPVESSPAVLEATPPVLAPEPQATPPVNPEGLPLDINNMNIEQLREFAIRQGGASQNTVQ